MGVTALSFRGKPPLTPRFDLDTIFLRRDREAICDRIFDSPTSLV